MSDIFVDEFATELGAVEKAAPNSLSVQQQIDDELHSYAMYVLQNRAIPSIVDGLKLGQRKAIYSALKVCKHSDPRIKTAALVGQTLKDGYHHGDSSMEGTISLMAAEWCNNIPIFDGEGSFGNRFNHEAGAGRYTSVRLSKAFNKIFRDFELLKDNPDPEFPEPMFYYPLIPWFALNGIEGIAFGFATSIQPRDPKVVLAMVQRLLGGKHVSDVDLPPHFPGWKGTVRWSDDKKVWEAVGNYDLLGRKGLVITEIPPMLDRETYVKHLLKLREKGKIRSFQDRSSKKANGFFFEIEFERGSDRPEGAEQIQKMFGLTCNLNENLTLLDENNDVIVFDNIVEAIRHFVNFRLQVVQRRLDYQAQELQKRLDWKQAEVAFIWRVLGMLKDRAGVMTLTRAELTEAAMKSTDVLSEQERLRLVHTPMWTFTQEAVVDANKEIAELITSLEDHVQKTPHGVYIQDLKNLSTEV